MSEWKKYRKVAIQEMRPYISGEDLSGVSVNHNEIPKEGGMIARDSKNHNSQWYITPEFFKENYVPADLMKTDGDKFVKHIKSHLHEWEIVICKICGKSINEIVND